MNELTFSNSWRILQYDAPTALEQMAVDEQLAKEAQPTLRLFRWSRPALSLGFKQPMPAWMEREKLASHGVELVERPTAGGIAIHGSDLSCSVVVPHETGVTLRTLMQSVCETLANAVHACNVECQWRCDVRASHRIDYCLTEESPYAIMVGGATPVSSWHHPLPLRGATSRISVNAGTSLRGERKLCGLALRRYPASWLVQGSLLMRPLPTVFARVMPREIVEAFQTRAISLEEATGRPILDDELTTRIMEIWQTPYVGMESLSYGVTV